MKIIRYLKFIFFSIIFILLVNCSSSKVSKNDLRQIEKGFNKLEVEEILSTPLKIVDLSSYGFKNVSIWYYNKAFTNRFTNWYALCFKDDKLYFYGYPHEFARNDDEFLNKIIKISNKEFLEKNK